jgi:hypothetical protein
VCVRTSIPSSFLPSLYGVATGLFCPREAVPWCQQTSTDPLSDDSLDITHRRGAKGATDARCFRCIPGPQAGAKMFLSLAGADDVPRVAQREAGGDGGTGCSTFQQQVRRGSLVYIGTG